MTDELRLWRRFWSKVLIGDGCWEWQAAISTGYGAFGMPGRRGPARAHRVSYEMLVGPIPEGLTLDHLCRNRACVRPDHLEPVTQRVNILRGTSPTAYNAQATICASGHPLSGDNLYRWKNRRYCRECRLRCDRESRARHTYSSWAEERRERARAATQRWKLRHIEEVRISDRMAKRREAELKGKPKRSLRVFP